jgi:hypothetical protein
MSVEDALSRLHEPGDVFEVRILGAPRAGTVAGYFDDASVAAAAIAKYDGNATGVYLTLNPANSDLMARAKNRLQEWAKYATKDDDVQRRRWLLVDVDYHRPSGISATDDEIEKAHAVALRVRSYLEDECAWPDCAFVHSGNGYHLLYRVDLDGGTESRDLVKRVLSSLAELFDEKNGVQIDTTVYNAARISKVPGTWACKGDDLPDRPHRRSQVIEWPEQMYVVSQSGLLHVGGPAKRPAATAQTTGGNGSGSTFDVEDFMRDHGLHVRKHKRESGGDLWELEVCPFNVEHDKGEAFVTRAASGALLAGCHHNGCTWRWEDLRDRLEPGYKERRNEWQQSQDAALEKPIAKPAAKTQPGNPAPITCLPAVSFGSLLDTAPERPEYVWFGYLAKGAVTELAAKPKVGKTRLALEIVRCVLSGEEMLGHTTLRCPVLYMTEQGHGSFISQTRASHLHDSRNGFHVLMRNPVRRLKWDEVGELAVAYVKEHGIGLVVVDTLSEWASIRGDDENSAGAAMAAMAPLHAMAGMGCAVLAVRHERKGTGDVGESARGSSAFGGGMDILMALRRTRGRGHETRRELHAVGRFDDAPPVLTMEYDLSSGSYSLVMAGSDVRNREVELNILEILPQMEGWAITVAEICDRIDVADKTARRALKDLVKGGVIKQGSQPREDGFGRSTVYWHESVLG